MRYSTGGKCLLRHTWETVRAALLVQYWDRLRIHVVQKSEWHMCRQNIINTGCCMVNMLRHTYRWQQSVAAVYCALHDAAQTSWLLHLATHQALL